MGAPTTDRQLELHDCFVAAASVVRTEVLLADASRRRPGLRARWKLRRALKRLDRVLELDRTHWSAMWLAGKAHQRLGEWDKAFARFEKAHAAAPLEADTAHEAAVCAMTLGLRDAAVRYAERAVTLEPGSPERLATAARAYLLAGRLPEAQAAAQLALSKDPRNANAFETESLCRRFVETGDAPPGCLPDLEAYQLSRPPLI